MRRWLKRVLIVLAVIVPLIAVFYFYAQWQGDRDLRAVIAELDAQGEPWRLDDLLVARPTGPEDEKVHALVDRVIAVARKHWKSKHMERSIPPNVFFPPDVGEVVAKDFSALERTIAEARSITSMPSGRYVVRYGAKVLKPPADRVIQFISFTELLQLAAMGHARQGDLDEAIQDCRAIQHASQILQNEPELLAQLVRLAMHAGGLDSLEHVQAQGTASPELLKQLQGALEKSGIECAMIMGVRGERAGMHRIYEAVSAGELALADFKGPSGNSTSLRDSLTDLYLRWNLKQSHTWTLRHMTAMLTSLELTEPERSARLRALQEEIRQAPRSALGGMQTCNHVIEAQRVTARTRCAITALALERYRQANEHWPQTLEELCQKFLASIPQDPCTGEPLKYRFTKDGVVVYSVGPDGDLRGTYRDDAKAPQTNARYEFRLWNVSQRRQLVAAKP
jgi:hypothetical protein